MDFLSAYPALHWAVPAPAHTDYYTSFYVLAFGLNLLLLLREGWRRGYPMRSWLVVLACSSLAFILGTKLLALSGAEWQQLLTTGQWPAAGARTVLGGAISGTLVLLALRRPFGFSWHMFDAFALPMCVALTIQCVGCVLTGCCFGELTDGSWGLTYGPGTWPYVAQAMRGAIPMDAAHSLPVHPTQLYTLLLCAGVGALLVFTRHKPWPGGSRNLLHLGLLLAGRGLIEFWRDPASEPVGATLHEHAGLIINQLQWVLLVVTPLVLGFWLWRVRQQSVATASHSQYEKLPAARPVLNLLAVAVLLLVTAWLGASALTLPEILVVKALLLGVLVLECGAFFFNASKSLQPVRVALPLGMASVIFVLTSQTPVDSARQERESYNTLSGGVSVGAFEREQNTDGGGCGGDTPLLEYKHRNVIGTIDYAHTTLPGQDADGDVHKAETTWGLRLHAGSDQQTPTSDSSAYPSSARQRNFLVAVNPYLRMERKWVGLGYGVILGNLGYHRLFYGDMPSYFDVQASLRVGPRETLFALADYNYLGYGMANPQHRLGIGTGFGGSKWQLLGGAATSKSYEVSAGQARWSGFVEAQGQLSSRWQASTFVLLGNPHQQQLGFRLGYRLPHKQAAR